MLWGTDFSNANLSGAVLEGARGRASFSGANARGARFDRSVSWETDFARADLEGASLVRAAVGKANLKGVDFDGANFEQAAFMIMGTAECTDEGVCSIKQSEQETRAFPVVVPPHYGKRHAMTNLKGANLEGAKNLTQAQLNASMGDERTMLPKGQGLSYPAHWLEPEEPPSPATPPRSQQPQQEPPPNDTGHTFR